jgi:hypothetical protein
LIEELTSNKNLMFYPVLKRKALEGRPPLLCCVSTPVPNKTHARQEFKFFLLAVKIILELGCFKVRFWFLSRAYLGKMNPPFSAEALRRKRGG